jgi:hypothetical protein|tara:strand:+ start:2233 stop:2394 length:162 start_codon:yes stop_codon:yes gene_type:complete
MIDLIFMVGLSVFGYGLFLFDIKAALLGVGGILMIFAIFAAKNSKDRLTDDTK